MGCVLINLSISLDGYIAAPNATPEQPLGDNGAILHHWMLHGETRLTEHIDARYHGFFNTDGIDSRIVTELFGNLGAMVFGRRTYDLVAAWGGSYPIPKIPLHIVTTRPPERVPEGDTVFHFHADPVAAVTAARKHAGVKHVGIAGGRVAAACLQAGVVDELYLHVVPVLLSGGTRLFDGAGAHALALLDCRKAETSGVTHLRYRVARSP